MICISEVIDISPSNLDSACVSYMHLGPFILPTFTFIKRLFSSSSLFAIRMVSSAYAAAAKSLQLCPTLCDPIDGSPPGSAVPGILQARTLERIAISFSRVSSQPRDRTQVSCIAGRFFTI